MSKPSRRARREAQRAAAKNPRPPASDVRTTASPQDLAPEAPGSPSSAENERPPTAGPNVGGCEQSATNSGNTERAPGKTPLEQMAALTEEINGLQSSMHPRWARFAQFLADGATQAQAAIDAGFALAGARQQGNRLAGEPVIAMLVEKLQMLDAISASAIRRPALRRVLMGVMEGGVHADQVAAVRVAMKLEGYDRTRIEVTGLAPAKSAEELRKDLAERMVRQREAKS